MTPYRKGGHSRTWWLTVMRQDGTPARLSTGSHDEAVARDMELMLRTLTRRGSRDWDVVDALTERDPARPHRRRLTLDRLYDHWTRGTLDRLRAELNDVDLAPAIDAWVATLEKGKAAYTRKAYTRYINRLAPLSVGPKGEPGPRLPLWRSTLTSARIAELRDAAPGGVPTQLASLTAWSSCCSYLVERGVLPENPCEKVAWPAAPKTDVSCHIARLEDVQRLVAGFTTAETRAIAALREATGADWDALEPMRRDHIVDATDRRVFLPGDKTGNREREVQVEAWAWRYVAEYLREAPALPGAKLFRIGHRAYLYRHHQVCDALRKVGVAIPEGYTPHNARHSFAVRKRRAGWKDWKIAAYLGNTADEISRTYGKFKATREDLREDRAAGDA